MSSGEGQASSSSKLVIEASLSEVEEDTEKGNGVCTGPRGKHVNGLEELSTTLSLDEVGVHPSALEGSRGVDVGDGTEK